MLRCGNHFTHCSMIHASSGVLTQGHMVYGSLCEIILYSLLVINQYKNGHKEGTRHPLLHMLIKDARQEGLQVSLNPLVNIVSTAHFKDSLGSFPL